MGCNHIRPQDVRGLLCLFGELHDLLHDPPALLAHELDGLMRVIGADGAGISLVADFRPGGAAVGSLIVVRGFTGDAARDFVRQSVKSTTFSDPAVAAFARSLVPGDTMTRCRRDLLTDAQWERGLACVEMRHMVRDALYSAAPAARSTDVFGLGLFRAGAGSRFSPVERALVQLFHEEMVTLYRKLTRPRWPSAAAEAAAALRPSYRKTLRAVLAGLGDKAIARRLGLSQHTVREYINALFAHFGVASRTELLALFLPPGALPE
jgi:DNA-binding CsgD family transcriptional regulator